jgi:hypothetical protein
MILSADQLTNVGPRDKLQVLSLRPIERAAEPRPYRANIGASSRPFILPRPDEQLDSCFLNVDPYFDCLMEIEDRKNMVVDSVVFTGNAIHGLDLHGFAMSTETRLAIRRIAYQVRMEPLTSAQSDATARADSRTLHVPVSGGLRSAHPISLSTHAAAV